jgi:hypothetical protein
VNHRPYPNADRALRQISRHDDEVGPVTEAGPRAVTPFGQQLIDGTSAAVQALSSSLAVSFAKMLPQQLPVDEYRLSTR